eukprot:TRINITY_DN1699_c0_g1_i3.p1 TRINITY_DN1699_c0_g1~~TRINITY_DN1699_c0_g1_i3.p1  ORF type:complete len:170 (+),score=2.74 TRINITY_DN1699_c0_g1_i3:99-608(+)
MGSILFMRSIDRFVKVGISGLVFDSMAMKKIFLIQRERNPYKGKWSFPGGHLEFGELVEQGLRREILEETGLKVRVLNGHRFPYEITEIVSKSDKEISSHFLIVTAACVIEPNSSIEAVNEEGIIGKFWKIGPDQTKDPAHLDSLTQNDCLPRLKPIIDLYLARKDLLT